MPLYQFVEKLLLIKYLVYRFWTRSSTLHLLLKKDSGFASSNIFLIFEQNPQVWPSVKKMCLPHTGKSLSEALIFASANPQYDDNIVHWSTSSIHENSKLRTWGEHVVYRNCFWYSEQFLYTTCSTHVQQKEEFLTRIYL